MFVKDKRFAVLFCLPPYCVNSLLLYDCTTIVGAWNRLLPGPGLTAPSGEKINDDDDHDDDDDDADDNDDDVKDDDECDIGWYS